MYVAFTGRSFNLGVMRDKTHKVDTGVPAKLPNVTCSCTDLQSHSELRVRQVQTLENFRRAVARVRLSLDVPVYFCIKFFHASNLQDPMTACIYPNCCFEADRQYILAITNQFLPAIAMRSSENPFFLKIQRLPGKPQKFESRTACVGVNTLRDHIKMLYCLVGLGGAAGDDKAASEYGRATRRKVMTGHTGRNTGITFALSSGVPAEVLAQSTGHADINTLRAYAQV